MAVLTSEQLQELRAACARELLVRYDKPTINAVMQAIEDVFESPTLRAAISNAIDTASAPIVFTPAEKRVLVKHWLVSRFRRGN